MLRKSFITVFRLFLGSLQLEEKTMASDAPSHEVKAHEKTAHLEHEDDDQDHVTAAAVGGNIDELPKGYYWNTKFIGSIIGIMLMAQSLNIGYILPASSLNVINADLGPSPNYVLITTMETAISGCLLALVGRLGDILGRRYFCIGGQVFGLVASIIGATAQSINGMIVAGALMGVAAGVQLTFTFVGAELVANRHRAYLNAIIVLGTYPVAGLGPAFARLIITNTKAGWRWFYYLNIITCGLSLILLTLFYFPPSFQQLHSRMTRWEQVKRIDWGGAVMFAAAGIFLMLGLSWGGTSYPWKDGHVISFIVIGAGLFIIFGFYEAYAPWVCEPLIPKRLLKNRNYLALTCCGGVGTMIYFSLNILWPQQIQALGYATTNINIGWLSCANGVAGVVGQTVAGSLFKRVGHGRWQLVACTVAMCIFMGGLAAANKDNRPLAIAFVSLGSFSVGCLELIHIIMVGLCCDPGDIGLASGLLASIRQVTGTIAATIYVVILQNRIPVEMKADVVPAALNNGLPQSSIPSLFQAISKGTAAALDAVPGITSKIEAAVAAAETQAYTSSFKTVYLSSISFGVLSVIAALCTQNVDKFMTGQVARQLQVKGHKTTNVEEDVVMPKGV